MSFFVPVMFLLTTSSGHYERFLFGDEQRKLDDHRTPRRLSSVLHESQTRFRASSNVFRRVYCLRLALLCLG